MNVFKLIIKRNQNQESLCILVCLFIIKIENMHRGAEYSAEKDIDLTR